MAKKLSEVITKAREEKGLTKRALARESGVDPSEILRIEKGKRQKPGLLALKGLSEVLDLSLEELMKLAGYSELEISFGKDVKDNYSTKDYQNKINEYERFYTDVLEEIEKRRKAARECKGIFSEIIDMIDYPDAYKKEISKEEISKKLKEASRIININTEKVDKDILPKNINI